MSDEAQRFDYRALLLKYINHVIGNEGIDYIKSDAFCEHVKHFTPEEWAEMYRLSEQAKAHG